MKQKLDDYGHLIFDEKAFEDKIQDRLKEKKKEEETVLPPGELKPLEALDFLDLARGIGKRRVVGDDVPFDKIGNYSCPTCELYFKSSAAYLRHLNSPEHNLKKGMSMKVAPTTDEEVFLRLQQWEDFYIQ